MGTSTVESSGPHRVGPSLSPAASDERRRAGWLVAALLALVTVAAYWNSLRAPFVFDDIPALVENPTIARLWPLTGPLQPPSHGETVTARPVLNLSFAIDRAFTGDSAASFRAGNIAIHLCTGLLLFGLVRRTLRARAFPLAIRDAARWIAAFAAGIWLLHPLQTEAVTYIVQRAESLMALLLLLTLYAFHHGVDGRRWRGWLVVSWAACLLGMGTKEVMVVAPLLVAAYDRTFFAASWREVFARRGGYYAALALTWVALAILVFGAGLNRGGSTANARALAYWATQPGAVLTYLARTLWPHPLIFDYGAEWPESLWAVAPTVLGLTTIVAFVVHQARRHRTVAFAGGWCLLILAPTCMVPGARQTIAEQRAYLALIPLYVVAIAAAHRLIGRRAWIALAASAVALAGTTARRNQDYRSASRLWADTVAKRPGNRWAHVNLGNTLAEAHRPAEALAHYEIALGIDPSDPIAHYDAANALVDLRRLPEAIAQFSTALRLDPDYTAARTNLADALAQAGQFESAVGTYEEALRRGPETADLHYNLGNALAHLGRLGDAQRELQTALQRRPVYPEASYNLGLVSLQSGHPLDAVARFEDTLRHRPNDSEAHNNLAAALAQLGRTDEALRHARAAVALDAANAAAHGTLGQLDAFLGERAQAVAEFRTVLRLDPQNAAARAALEQLGAAPESPAQ